MNSAARRCADAIRRVGGAAALLKEGERVLFSASIQPRLSEREEDSSPLGIGQPCTYTLFTPWSGAGQALAAGDRVEYQGLHYYVCQVSRQDFQGEPVYRWAVLRQESGDAPEEEDQWEA